MTPALLSGRAATDIPLRLTLISAAHAPVLALVAWGQDAPAVAVGLLSLALSLLGVAAWRLAPEVSDVVLAAALVGQAALLTASLAGHPWQPDSHMYSSRPSQRSRRSPASVHSSSRPR